MPPDVAAGLHQVVGVLGAADDDHTFHRGIAGNGRVGVLLEGDDVATPPAAVGGNHHFGLGILNAIPQRFGAEPAENDAVRGADARAGQHCDGQLRHHRQVDGNPVALLHAQAFQPVGELAHLPVQIPVGIDLPVARLALPDDGGLVLARPVEMAVNAVVGYIELPAQEPLGKGGVRPVQHRIPGAEPVQLPGKPRPEPLRILARRLINAGVGDVGAGGKLRRRRVGAVLLQQGFKSAGILRHRKNLRGARGGAPASSGRNGADDISTPAPGCAAAALLLIVPPPFVLRYKPDAAGSCQTKVAGQLCPAATSSECSREQVFGILGVRGARVVAEVCLPFVGQ